MGDSLTGNGGADTFLYTGASQSSSTTYDTVTDFAAGTDHFDLTTAITGVFAVAWFLLAAANMWIGISRAGYSFLEELPIFLVIYLFPVTVAVFAKWKFM